MTHCENGAFPCPDHDNCIPDLFMDYLTIRVFPDNHYIISIYFFPMYIYIIVIIIIMIMMMIIMIMIINIIMIIVIIYNFKDVS